MVERHQGRGCFPSVGPRLGSVDPYLVRDLGLPALDDHVGPQAGPVGPVVEASGGSSQSSGGPVVKFQLGETQPFVPVRGSCKDTMLIWPSCPKKTLAWS